MPKPASNPFEEPTEQVRLTTPIDLGGVWLDRLTLRLPRDTEAAGLAETTDLKNLRIGQIANMLSVFAGIPVAAAEQIALADYPAISNAIKRLGKRVGF